MYVINSERTLISLKEAPVKFFFFSPFFQFQLKLFLFGGGEPYVSLFMWGN